MLEKEDLRLGNIVISVSHNYKQVGDNPSEITETHRTPREICSINAHGISWYVCAKSGITQGKRFEGLEGILLNKEVLLSYGFIYTGRLYHHPILPANAFFSGGEIVIGTTQIRTPYLHTLQNIFRDITGKNLIKTNENE